MYKYSAKDPKKYYIDEFEKIQAGDADTGESDDNIDDDDISDDASGYDILNDGLADENLREIAQEVALQYMALIRNTDGEKYPNFFQTLGQFNEDIM